MAYDIKPLPFDPKDIKGLSEKLLISHYENNYSGAVRRLNTLTAQLADTSLVNAPEHLASFKGIAPIVPELALLGLRATLETPRRIRLDSSDTTGTSLILDATVSGTLKSFGLHYTFGIYNLADQRAQVPVTGTFASRVMPQNGRTLLFDLTGTFQ